MLKENRETDMLIMIGLVLTVWIIKHKEKLLRIKEFILVQKYKILLFFLIFLIVIYLFYKLCQWIKTKLEDRKKRNLEIEYEKGYIQKFLDSDLRVLSSEELKSLVKKMKKKEFHRKSMRGFESEIKIKLKEAKKIFIELEHEERINYLRREEYFLKGKIERLNYEKRMKKAEGKRRNVVINVDEDYRFFRKKDLNMDEVDFLLLNDYKIARYKSLMSDKVEEFLLKPRHNESLTHLFVTFDICNYLESKGVRVQKFVTKKPDIVFVVGGKRFAIEVETGSVLTKVSRMKEKLEVLKGYDEWFFVVTKRNKVKKYKEFGNTVDLRYVKLRLDKILK